MASVGCDGSHPGWWTGSSIPGTMVASLSAGWFVVLFMYLVIFLKKQGESNWEMEVSVLGGVLVQGTTGIVVPMGGCGKKQGGCH